MPTSTWQGAHSPALPIKTVRLRLITIVPQMIAAKHEHRDLPLVAGLEVPAEWPPEHWENHVYDYLLERMHRYPEAAGWCRYVAITRPHERPLLIGNVGCTEPPETSSDVEIGYALLPSYHRQGYGTEAVTAFIGWIFNYSNVLSVNAQTFPHLEGSLGILRKCGFCEAGSGAEEGTVRFRRFRLA